jgi:hypothetical protein
MAVNTRIASAEKLLPQLYRQLSLQDIHLLTTHLCCVDIDCKVGSVAHEVGVADVVLGHTSTQDDHTCRGGGGRVAAQEMITNIGNNEFILGQG